MFLPHVGLSRPRIEPIASILMLAMGLFLAEYFRTPQDSIVPRFVFCCGAGYRLFRNGHMVSTL